MKRGAAYFLSLVLLVGTFVPAARAAVNIERQGSENPVVEVAKSVMWGGVAGLVLGSAIAFSTKETDSDGDIIRWSFVAGTFTGLGYGVYHVANRPAPTALLHFEHGQASLHATLPRPERGHGMALRLVGVTF